MTRLFVALAGGGGAAARVAVDRWVRRRTARRFPIGTFVVNVTGSFALGGVVGLATAHGLSLEARAIVGTGFLGAYTTFSTFAFETFRLIEERAPVMAVTNAVGSLIAGTGAAALGLMVSGGW